ncbi:MAG: hypothetical protein CL942_07275 [Desulfovibrio sp.]|nr:hypothetical protein [Desulfovibrio sp.]
MSDVYNYELKHDCDGRIVENLEKVKGESYKWTYKYDKEGRLAEAILNGRRVCKCEIVPCYYMYEYGDWVQVERSVYDRVVLVVWAGATGTAYWKRTITINEEGKSKFTESVEAIVSMYMIEQKRIQEQKLKLILASYSECSREEDPIQEMVPSPQILGLGIPFPLTGRVKLRSCLASIFIGLFLFLLMGQDALAEDRLAWNYVASTPGVITVLNDANGLSMQLEVMEVSSERLLIEQRTCCFDASQGGVPRVARYHLDLHIDGSRLILVEGDVESVLLDLESESWTIPVEIQTLEREGSSSSIRAECAIVSRKKTQLMGEKREVLVVECVYEAEDMPESTVVHSFASGLGIVQLNGFKLDGLD